MYLDSFSKTKSLSVRFFPEPMLRERCLSLFAESIRTAHCHAPDEWTVSLHPREIRLVVGHLIPFSLMEGRIWIALDLDLLEAIDLHETCLNEARSWQWKTKHYSVFKLVPSRNGYYFPDKDPLEKLWPMVWKLNAAFIKRIGNLKRRLHPQSRAKYEPAVLEFLRQELNQPVPNPGTDLSLPEEIGESQVFYEGARKRVSVNAYERSPAARRICLEHHGTRCAVCAQDMSEIYGPVADGLIHVHHLKPLSEIKEDYEINPIADLLPVCPNCHAVIHRRKPPYTIEELKGFWEKAGQARQTH